MSVDAKFTVYGSQIQKWSNEIQMLVKQRDQYKLENEQLKEEVERLNVIIKDEEDWKAIEQEYEERW